MLRRRPAPAWARRRVWRPDDDPSTGGYPISLGPRRGRAGPARVPSAPPPAPEKWPEDPGGPPRGGPSEAAFYGTKKLPPVPKDPPKPLPVDDRAEAERAALGALRATEGLPPPKALPPRAPPPPPGEWPPPLPPPRTDLPPAALGLDQDDGVSQGAALQLACQAPQDYYYTIHPEITFFRQGWKRHTPCAEDVVIDAPADGVPPGATSRVVVSRGGHVLGDLSLEIRLPDLGVPGRWTDAVGYALVARARLVVGDTTVQEHERLWLDMSDRLFAPHGRRACTDEMIGRGRVLATDRPHTLLVPLRFLDSHGNKPQWLPLCAVPLQTPVAVEVTLDALQRCCTLDGGATPVGGWPRRLAMAVHSRQGSVSGEELAALTDPAAPQALLVETVLDMDELTTRFDDRGAYDVDSVRVRLDELNLPVRALAFVAYDDNDAGRGTFFRYLPDVVRAATLYLGGSTAERFEARGPGYFQGVQAYQHSARVPLAAEGVYLYSFALDAGARHPCGAVNFAPLQKPALRVDLVPGSTAGAPVKVKAFAMCYNWLLFVPGAPPALRFA